MRDSVPGNKYAFLNSLETTISFFLGGPSLERGDYLVLNKNNDSYSKIDISPQSLPLYKNLYEKIKKNSDEDKIFKNIFTFLNNIYKKFQSKEPSEIKDLLEAEIDNLVT